MRDLEQKAKEADEKNKIWQYKIRRIVFFFMVTGGILTILDKCPLFKRTQMNVVAPESADSTRKGKSQPKTQLTSTTHKFHQRKPETSIPAMEGNSQVSARNSDVSATHPFEKPKPRDPYPVQISNSDNIQFKLLNAEGSKGAQTIKITMVLTTSSANRFIWQQVNSIIDPEGNEYKLKSFTNGASTYDTHVALNTGVPIKLTFTFGGVLPNVRDIKLFKFEYRHKSLDDNIAVEFRDVLVAWE